MFLAQLKLGLSTIEYINIIPIKTTTPKISASRLLSEKYSAAAAKANITNCSMIRTGTVTGKVAFGDINVPQKIAIIRGVAIPNNILKNLPRSI